MICLNLFDNLKQPQLFSSLPFNMYNIIFIIIAAFVSTLGLLYNSTSAIVGSMIISSIPNSILSALIYFLTDQYYLSLSKVLHFMVLVFIAVTISVFSGYYNRVKRVFKTPTDEMKARVTYTHVLVDVLFAIISGVGLSLALINNDTISKVGFSFILAITPPLCNFGLYYGEALYEYTQNLDSEGNQIDKNEEHYHQLMDDGNKSLLLFTLNILSMVTALLFSLNILCKTNIAK